MSSEQLGITPKLDKFLWTKSCPLKFAARNFAPEEVKQRLLDTSGISPAEVFQESLKRSASAASKDFLSLFSNAIQQSAHAATARRTAEEDAHNALRTALTEGSLVAFGYEEKRLLESTPVKIPSHIFKTCHFEFVENRVQKDALLFVDVGVLKRDPLPNLKREWESQYLPAPTSPVRGRPSQQRDIIVAFNALQDGGVIDSSQSFRSIYPMIREWLCHHKPDIGYSSQKPSNTAIYDAIRDL